MAAANTKPPVPYNPNKSPKQRFVEISQWIREHRQMVDSPAFTRGCDYALLQFQQSLAASITDGTTAATVGLQIKGAQLFLEMLRNLSETPTPPARRNDDNLTH